MKVVTATPSAPLASVVRRYVGYRQTGIPPGIHRGLPTRDLTFIVSLEAPVRTAAPPDPTQAPVSLQALVCGLHTRAALIARNPVEYGIAVETGPLAARALFGLPAGELAGTVVDLSTLLGRVGVELVDRLSTADTWTARFAILDEVLARQIGRTTTEVPPEVRHAWRRLTGTGTPPPMETLANEVGWSRRHLTKRFHQEVGLPPRQLRRVLRFERSLTLLRTGQWRTMTDLASAAGYHDHPHLLHEWTDLAGCIPTTWLTQEHLRVQEALDDR
ncbi:Helix-turn-helix domain-containing protein [Thermomonospora echinospora]|uniref:Helix-turn-helix domain-containing protein n=2 Tax=Thermomonospora echinospora TaxID=1992 RepID=A0A1H6CHM7_9ACTN|nr:Helix-turn-helix domain-containing protein [Thermomonospora echinospora]